MVHAVVFFLMTKIMQLHCVLRKTSSSAMFLTIFDRGIPDQEMLFQLPSESHLDGTRAERSEQPNAQSSVQKSVVLSAFHGCCAAAEIVQRVASNQIN